MRQMSYSMCRFWAYDESKKILGAGKDAPAWKLAAAGSMGSLFTLLIRSSSDRYALCPAGGIAGFVGNPGGALLSHFDCTSSRFLGTEIVMVRLQGDFAKPPEKRFNYKHCFDALFRVSAPSLYQKGLSYLHMTSSVTCDRCLAMLIVCFEDSYKALQPQSNAEASSRLR
jgi:hypothetical protein